MKDEDNLFPLQSHRPNLFILVQFPHFPALQNLHLTSQAFVSILLNCDME